LNSSSDIPELKLHLSQRVSTTDDPQTRDKEEAITLYKLIIPTITFSSCLHANLKSNLGRLINPYMHLRRKLGEID
jgi:hypothetical protein